jgi:LPXTG-motif cell wall-anchored protein
VASDGGNVVGSCDIAGTGDRTGVTDIGLDEDFVPGADSPAVDAGLTANISGFDLVGTARPLDGNGDGVALPDAGALEAPAVAPAPAPVDPPAVDDSQVGAGGQGGQGGAATPVTTGSLPYTGIASILPLLLGAVAMIGTGAGAMVVYRRRAAAAVR